MRLMALQEAETLRQRYGRHVLQGLVNEIFQAARAKDVIGLSMRRARIPHKLSNRLLNEVLGAAPPAAAEE